jgi:hypothetical protein
VGVAQLVEQVLAAQALQQVQRLAAAAPVLLLLVLELAVVVVLGWPLAQQ